MRQFILFACLFTSVTTQTLKCEHFNKNHAIRSPTDYTCKDSEIDGNGSCNTTELCVKDEEVPGRQPNCFVSWTNESGKVEIIRKGCWSQSKPCLAKCEAVTIKSVFFCCCDNDLCNSHFSLGHINKTIKTNEENPVVVPTNEETWVVLVYTLVPITLLSLLVVLIYWIYRKRKHSYGDIDNASVQTPGSGLTTSTQNTQLLIPPEINLPQLIDIKARGRFGCVWKAQLHDRFVAVKVFFLQDKQSWLNEQEVFNTELVHYHPHILNFIAAASRGVGVETELWLITEFHEYGSLADYLKTHTMSLPVALKFMETMATGLSFLHEDIPHKQPHKGHKPAIAHRDFKSKNVLISNDMTAVIADFGLAVKFIPGECTGESHGQVGTRRYMAPEILEGAINFQRDAFLRIDMYAFALVMWEIITRCSDVPGGSTPTYMMPYELELGQHPTLDEMQACVIDQKTRPVVNDLWRQDEVVGILCETMEECWDHDAEARLSAGCVEERINHLHRRIQPPNELAVHPNMINNDVIRNGAPVIGNGAPVIGNGAPVIGNGTSMIGNGTHVIIPPSPTSDTDIQNQINNRKNQELPVNSNEKLTNEVNAAGLVATVTCDAETALLSAGDRESNV
uniref:Serine/threonine-protein kinase receptor n=1 Tax=Ciona intestinalis TaxID=7719 RepID=F6WDR9_CIOIN|nr:transforming growth factor beta receptor isoform X1 [Ciona intestinalis]|eukprot:XP_026693851.1 transforming growth factor beta receptor isoform X1 [Ciona intestinalis]